MFKACILEGSQCADILRWYGAFNDVHYCLENAQERGSIIFGSGSTEFVVDGVNDLTPIGEWCSRSVKQLLQYRPFTSCHGIFSDGGIALLISGRSRPTMSV